MENERILELLENINTRVTALEEMLNRREQVRNCYYKRKEHEQQERQEQQREQLEKINEYLTETINDGERIPRVDLYKNYCIQCRKDGRKTPHKSVFFYAMREAGLNEIKSHGIYYVFK